jgi:hypothetical protein
MASFRKAMAPLSGGIQTRASTTLYSYTFVIKRQAKSLHGPRMKFASSGIDSGMAIHIGLERKLALNRLMTATLRKARSRCRF